MTTRRQHFGAAGAFGAGAVTPRAKAVETRSRFVEQDGFAGRLHAPAAARSRVGVVFMGGSEGGMPPAADADDLAASGLVVLALAFFRDRAGQPASAPASLEEVPVETVLRALDWLKLQPDVDPRRVAIVAQSRGAELALLVASMSPDVAAVAAFSPSSRIWNGIPSVPGAFRPKSAWTLMGEPVPFQVCVPEPGTPMRDWFAKAASRDAARIPVERVTGPVLLASSRADAIWPSADFADEIAAGLAMRRPDPGCQDLRFDDASHLLMGTGPGMTRLQVSGTQVVIEFGGTPHGTALARTTAWEALRTFLATVPARG